SGARVRIYAGITPLGSATTGPDGTFASVSSGADAVSIDCKFCERTRLRVGSEGIVVAIIRRYDAVGSEVPTNEDLSHLPYAGVESALSLTPFVLLSQDGRSVIGPQLDDRRISGHGGLFVINGTPNYDIETNASAYATIPDYDASQIAVKRSSLGYLYGDTADAGTFIVDTNGGTSVSAAGSGAALKAVVSSNVSGASAALSSVFGEDIRSRADASLGFSGSGYAGNVSLGTGRGFENLPGDVPFASSFSSLRLAAERTSGADVSASLIADRGTYFYDSFPYPANVAWSDWDARAMIRARSVLSPFAQVSFRRSTGESRLGQTRFVAGATLNEAHFSGFAALGTDAISYDAYDKTTTAPAHAHDAIVSGTWTPSDAVSLEASARTGYWLPPFAFAYDANPGAPIVINQSNSLESTLSFNDARRFRFSLTALRFRDQAGTESGSAGASLAWQITPKISVRSWMLRSGDTQSDPAAFGSTWATYQNGNFHMDWIVRREVRNGLPDAHVDGAIGGALNRYASWFIATERRNGLRTLRLGVRF
ncbi:MAG: hypothetical protein M3N13_09600, partial [Candidatus Eremiobacteraeota bacterium]|nr:hypothetical protein [Candidatus Eremiobacteraeota bacterium]